MKEHYLSILRDRNTGMEEFREATKSLAYLIASEVAKELAATPMQKIVIIPILRAGLTLLPSFLEVFKGAPVGFFGIRREEETALPILYYEKLPSLSATDRIALLDPMLATGGSANLAIQKTLEKGATPEKIRLITILSSKQGIAAVQKKYPSVTLSSVAVDPSLDAQKFIVPGLGDFGDRYFGTT